MLDMTAYFCGEILKSIRHRADVSPPWLDSNGSVQMQTKLPRWIGWEVERQNATAMLNCAKKKSEQRGRKR